MATPTSSSNRSKRKGTKPITQGQNPQRGNRQKVSKAQVTNSTNRGSNTGSAKVTTGKGASKPVPKALPPGTKGGPLATQGRTSLKGQPQLPPGRKGGPMEKAGPTVDVKANAPKLKGSTPKPSGNFKAPNIPKPTAAAGSGATAGALSRVASGARNLLGNAMVPLAMAGEVSAMMDRDRRWNEYKDRNYGNTRVKPKQGNAQSRFAGAREANLNRINNDPRFAAPAEKPKPPAPRASDLRPSQTTPSRSTASGGGGGSQRSAAPQAAKPAMPGRKWEDFNPGRGTSKSNNPLLDRDAGGFSLRERMKLREEAQKADKAKNLPNNFGQDSGYQPQTKVDGSKYADKKPDMKKVNEYDRRKRRYYD